MVMEQRALSFKGQPERCVLKPTAPCIGLEKWWMRDSDESSNWRR